MNRKILHLDLDAYFCAVEELRDPNLRGKPFAVGGRPEERGVVSSCSYAARRMGVHSAMPMWRAIRLCPGLLVIPSRHGVYSQVSRQVFERLHNLTPLVEQVSIDEAFLDISDLPEPPVDVARRLQSQIYQELELPCSLGVATNKLLAKIANDAGKAAARKAKPTGETQSNYPMAITAVPPGQEEAFLRPLPVQALWGVGPKTAERLAELGIRTIGDLAGWPAEELARLFGKNGHDLARRSHGVDEAPIVVSHAARSVSQEITYSVDTGDGRQIRHTLKELSEGVGRQLRRSNLCCQTVRLKLRWPDFTTLSRQVTLQQATDQDAEIYQAAMELLGKVWREGKKVRLLGVAASNLGPPARQLSLWDAHMENTHSEKDRRLQMVLDELHQKYGEEAIVPASRIKKKKK